MSCSLLFLACIGVIIPSTAKMIYGGQVITGERVPQSIGDG